MTPWGTGKTITLAHGAGGRAMRELITELIVPSFDNGWLAPLEDQARLPYEQIPPGSQLAFTTASVPISPPGNASGETT